MKTKICAFILSVCFMISCILCLSACDNNDNSNNNNKIYTSLTLEYMSDLMINNENISAYSLKANSENTSNKLKTLNVDNTLNNKISLLSAKQVLSDNQDKKKPNNILYCTKSSYQNGEIVFNENAIEKVTFKKNTETTKDVYDNNGNLIDTNTIITQEEIDSQINKIFTTKQFTFIQFVALVDESGLYNYIDENGIEKSETINLRPASLIYDENGVSDYDKTDYFSSALTVSFVIDNNTGYIYKIENFHIKEFKNGLVVDSNCNHYKISVDNNDNLLFTDILPNKDIELQGAIIDNYGWTVICNNIIDDIYPEQKIIMTTNYKKYCYDDNNNVYVLNYYENTGLDKITHKLVDGQEVSLIYDSIITNIKPLYRTKNSSSSLQFYDMYYNLYNYVNPETDSVAITMGFLSEFSTGNGLEFDNLEHYKIRWLRKFDIILVMVDNYLYYKYIDSNDYLTNCITYNLLDFEKVSNTKMFTKTDYYQQVGNDSYKIKNVFYNPTINGTSYYQLRINNNSIDLIELNSVSYDSSIFIFQPINK